MSDWQAGDEDQDPWPVKFPVETPPRETGKRFREHTPSRWLGPDKVDSGEVQKRLLWLLLAVEIGMVLVAACVLPLVFVRLPVREEGVLGAILSEVERLLGLSSQVTCLVLVLPIPLFLLMLTINVWWFRRLRDRSEQKGEGQRES